LLLLLLPLLRFKLVGHSRGGGVKERAEAFDNGGCASCNAKRSELLVLRSLL
jgi:hypothetical protein